jgi:hypothetical protein
LGVTLKRQARYAALGVLEKGDIWVSLNFDVRMTAPNAEQST